MKRIEVIKKLNKAAKKKGLDLAIYREGANHTIYDLDGLHLTVMRHNEYKNGQAERLFRQAAPKLGDNWWR